MKLLSTLLVFWLWSAQPMADELLITHHPLNSQAPAGLDKDWRLITDGVMGGLSRGTLTKDLIDDKPCIRLRGDISLKNNGGFIQAALDIGTTKAADASAYQGFTLEVYGNNATYNLHLRTADIWLPWQSYRASFVAPGKWQTIQLPFSAFSGYRIGKPIKLAKLERIGIVAIGQEFSADLCIAKVALYRDSP